MHTAITITFICVLLAMPAFGAWWHDSLLAMQLSDGIKFHSSSYFLREYAPGTLGELKEQLGSSWESVVLPILEIPTLYLSGGIAGFISLIFLVMGVLCVGPFKELKEIQGARVVRAVITTVVCMFAILPAILSFTHDYLKVAGTEDLFKFTSTAALMEVYAPAAYQIIGGVALQDEAVKETLSPLMAMGGFYVFGGFALVFYGLLLLMWLFGIWPYNLRRHSIENTKIVSAYTIDELGRKKYNYKRKNV